MFKHNKQAIHFAIYFILFIVKKKQFKHEFDKVIQF